MIIRQQLRLARRTARCLQVARQGQLRRQSSQENGSDFSGRQTEQTDANDVLINAPPEFPRVPSRLGSVLGPHYRPSRMITNPPSPSQVTLELLMASQTHIGHAAALWHPANQEHIFGIREGVHIISLEATATYLQRAAKVVRETCRQGGIVLFVGTRPGQQQGVVNAAKLAEGCHLFERWIAGGISNAQAVFGRCAMKVVDEFDNEIPDSEHLLENRPPLRPDLVVCLDPKENYILLKECGVNGIPTIGVIDTNVDPSWVTYPIPANDDSLRSVELIAGVLGRAGQEGQAMRRKDTVSEAAARAKRRERGLDAEMKLRAAERAEEQEYVEPEKK